MQCHFLGVCDGHSVDRNLNISIKRIGMANSHDDPEMIKNLRALFMMVKKSEVLSVESME